MVHISATEKTRHICHGFEMASAFFIKAAGKKINIELSRLGQVDYCSLHCGRKSCERTQMEGTCRHFTFDHPLVYQISIINTQLIISYSLPFKSQVQLTH
ncbi:hypothetical protein QQ045_019763 [Rhodiola kirilowii]